MRFARFEPILLMFVLLILVEQGGRTHASADLGASATDWESVIESAQASLLRDPRSMEALRMLGEANIALGDTLQGIRHLKQALSIEPHDPPCLVMLVENLLARGEINEADKYVAAAEAKDNRGRIWEIKATRASILAVQGQLPQALRILSEAAAKNPDNSLYPKLLARLYKDRDIFELSIDYYRRAIALDMDNAALRFELAHVLLDDKQFEEAMTEFKVVRERDPSNLEVNYQIGKLYFAAGHLEDAVEPLKAAAHDRPEHFLSHYLLGQTLRRLGRLEEAEISLKRSVEIRPLRRDVQKLLAKNLAEEKKYEEEIVLLESLISSAEVDPELLVMAGEAYYRLAAKDSNDATISRHTDSALVYYKRSLTTHPAQPRTTYRVATMYYNEEKFDSAAVYYQKTLQLQAENCGAMINMGYSYGRLEKWDEAIQALRMGTACDKKNKSAHSYLASILAAQDSLDAAVEMYHAVIALDSKDGEAYGQIGLIYFNKEQYKLAIRNLDQAVIHCPDRGDYWKLFGYANWSQFMQIRESIRDEYDGLIPGDELFENGGGYLKSAKKGFEKALRYEPNDKELKDTLKAVTDYLRRLAGK
jgi:tetratricopeptide (TPR) repeat protein